MEIIYKHTVIEATKATYLNLVGVYCISYIFQTFFPLLSINKYLNANKYFCSAQNSSFLQTGLLRYASLRINIRSPLSGLPHKRRKRASKKPQRSVHNPPYFSRRQR